MVWASGWSYNAQTLYVYAIYAYIGVVWGVNGAAYNMAYMECLGNGAHLFLLPPHGRFSGISASPHSDGWKNSSPPLFPRLSTVNPSN